jgi:hypothetical protein
VAGGAFDQVPQIAVAFPPYISSHRQYRKSMRSMKPTRNDPCWCGSGKKIKKCHLDRADLPRMPLSEGLDALREAKRSTECNSPEVLHIDCTGDPVDSHTISKSLGLRRLSTNNHVLALKHDISTLKRTGGQAEIGEVSINKMSVFPGFCAFHDKALFAPIEDRPFAGTAEQCALLSYRALARERHSKIAGSYVNEALKGADRGTSVAAQVAIQSFLADYGTGLAAAAADLEPGMASYHQAVVTGDYSAFSSLILELPEQFPMLCSLGHMPSEDWGGRIIQDLTDVTREADWVTAVAFQSADRAWVVFTWLRERMKIRSFVESLLANFSGCETDALIKYFF